MYLSCACACSILSIQRVHTYQVVARRVRVPARRPRTSVRATVAGRADKLFLYSVHAATHCLLHPRYLDDRPISSLERARALSSFSAVQPAAPIDISACSPRHTPSTSSHLTTTSLTTLPLASVYIFPNIFLSLEPRLSQLPESAAAATPICIALTTHPINKRQRHHPSWQVIGVGAPREACSRKCLGMQKTTKVPPSTPLQTMTRRSLREPR